MRLFTGIDLSDNVRDKLERLLMHLRPTAHVKWSAVYNLHVSIKLIGEWPEQKLPQLEDALRGIPKRSAIPIEICGLGWFPNPHQPRVFWAAVKAGGALEQLVRETETALEPLGIAKEERPYSAHLTLARIKQPAPLQALQQAVAALESVEFGSFTAACFHLYRTQPGSAGSIYTKLSEYPFAA